MQQQVESRQRRDTANCIDSRALAPDELKAGSVGRQAGRQSASRQRLDSQAGGQVHNENTKDDCNCIPSLQMTKRTSLLCSRTSRHEGVVRVLFEFLPPCLRLLGQCVVGYSKKPLAACAGRPCVRGNPQPSLECPRLTTKRSFAKTGTGSGQIKSETRREEETQKRPHVFRTISRLHTRHRLI